MQREIDSRLNLLLMHAEGLTDDEIRKTIEFMEFLWKQRFSDTGTLWKHMPLKKQTPIEGISEGPYVGKSKGHIEEVGNLKFFETKEEK